MAGQAHVRSRKGEIMSTPTSEIIQRLQQGLDATVLFREEGKYLLLLGLISQGHILIEGFPGTAKTHLSHTFARLIGGDFKRIQGTPDMLPADILGFYIFRQGYEPTLVSGPIFSNVLMVDELNRLSPRTQAALIEAMQERQVTIEGHTFPLEPLFMVVASQVPTGSVGTSPLPDVQSDRFMFCAWSGYPSPEEEDAVLQNIDRISDASVQPVVSLAEIQTLQNAARAVTVSDAVRRYIIAIVGYFRQHPDILAGPSIRGSLALYRGSRAAALIDDRDYVIPDDVKRLAVPALRHRLHLKAEAETDNVSLDTLIRNSLNSIPVPRV